MTLPIEYESYNTLGEICMAIKKKIAKRKTVKRKNSSVKKKPVAKRKSASVKKVVRKTVTKKKVAPKKKVALKPTAKVARKKTVKTVKKVAAKAAPIRKSSAIQKPLTKPQLLTALSENTGVSRKDVVAVMDEMARLIERHIKKRGAGQFMLPGLLKIRSIKKKATKARKGRNPFSGEEIMIAAKPASTTVRVTPLRALKNMTG